MRRSRIYIDSDLALQGSVILPVSSAHYVKNVLRLNTGQQIILFNGKDAHEYIAEIEIQRKQIVATPVASGQGGHESTIKTTLMQAIGKPEHVDFLIQKTTELGINQLSLFNSERTQHYLKGDRLQKKLAHWKNILISACEQCGRNQLPVISFHASFSSALMEVSDSNKIMLDFEGSNFHQIKGQCNQQAAFTLLVGAEGGLSGEEREHARQAGFIPCLLGPRVLRMETAAISIVTIIQHQFGDMQ